MNKTEKFEIFQKLDSLFTYSQLLPDEFRDKYLDDLDVLKKRLTSIADSTNKPANIPVIGNSFNDAKKEIKSEAPPSLFSAAKKPVIEENEDETEEKDSLKPNIGSGIKSFSDDSEKVREIKTPTIGMKPAGGKPPLPPPPPLHNVNAFTDFKKNINSMNVPPTAKQVEADSTPEKPLEPVIKKSTFEHITSLLIPKLTEKGRQMKTDLSLPIDDYLVLKIIDDKSTLYKLFENYNNKHNSSFIDFSNTLYSLEIEKCITFIKTESTIKDMGIIKLEELISEGKVVSETNIAKAIEFQRTTGSGAFLGKTLVELKYLTENSLGFCLKIQKWVSRMTEKAEYVNIKPTVAEPLPTSQATANKTDRPLIPQVIQPGKPVMNIPQAMKPEIIEEKPVSAMLDFVVPVFNQKGKDILESPDHQELAKRLRIIDEKSSLLDTYWINRESFKKNKLSFLKLILKLASQDILEYHANQNNEEKIVWIRFGELLTNLDITTSSEIEEALEYIENSNKEMYIGEALVELGFIDNQTLDDCLKVQEWYNSVLASISYERTFVDAIKSVLKDSFKCMVDIGSLRKVSFQNPLKDIVYIKYNISGKLNGRVFYISDRAFMQKLAKTLMNSVGNDSQEFDESYVATVCTVIISNSLAKLSQMGLFSNSDIPRIIMEKEVSMDKEIIVADRNTISMIPLINDFGRFAIGLEAEIV